MTNPIHPELLDLIGAKAFMGVMERGKDALSVSTQEILSLAYTVIAQRHPQGLPYTRALAKREALQACGYNTLAQGLIAQGEKGLKTAARKVYESVFSSAGLPTTGLFKIAPDVQTPPAKNEAPSERVVTEKVYKVLCNLLGMERSAIAPSNSLLADLGADSLDVVEITMGLEDELNIEINDDDTNDVHTVQDVIDLVQRMVAKK